MVDKIAGSDFGRPQDGPEGAAEKCSCIFGIQHIPVHKAQDVPSNERASVLLGEAETLFHRRNKSTESGEVSEWLKEHAWKVCIR